MIVRAMTGIGFLLLAGVAWWASRAASYAWDTRPAGCAERFQRILTAATPERDPVVEKCTGDDPHKMLCFVNSLQDGQRRTDPIRWNCVQPQ